MTVVTTTLPPPPPDDVVRVLLQAIERTGVRFMVTPKAAAGEPPRRPRRRRS